jgi:hypothetical protein
VPDDLWIRSAWRYVLNTSVLWISEYVTQYINIVINHTYGLNSVISFTVELNSFSDGDRPVYVHACNLPYGVL